jgi:hypothetical protein
MEEHQHRGVEVQAAFAKAKFDETGFLLDD